jgi:hypothetical protein
VRIHGLLLASTLPCALLACGGGTPAPAAPTPDPASAASAGTPSASATPAPSSAASAPPAAPADDKYEDAETDPTTLQPLFDKGGRPSFPKATGSPATCWQQVSLTGSAEKDYDALAAKCGAPTGAVPYVKPALGKLHSVKDKRDTYLLHLQGGLCYRYFGVADGTVKDLDILILQAKGALVGDDKATGPIAIIEMDKAWCQDRDVDYQFGVEVDGTGTGNYVFGVWAQAK